MATEITDWNYIILPSINSKIEAEIILQIDASLPDDQKLPILYQAGAAAQHKLIKQNALVWAYNRFADENARKLFVNGVAGILDLGLVRKAGDVSDGDWRATNVTESFTADIIKNIASLVTVNEMKKGLTIAVATKVNYWLINHHIGQGTVAGYVKKVMDIFFDGMQVSDQMITAVHSLGHFTSTLGVLSAVGMKNIRNSVAITHVEGALVSLADIKLRFESLPAGTGRLKIAYESAKRLMRSFYAQYCPGVDDFKNLPKIRKNILENPARYHIEASYLTGAARADYQDIDNEKYLGRLGTFILTLHKNSTLAKSPYMSQSRVQNYLDYDANFKQLLIRLQQRHAAAQIEAVAVAPEEILKRLRDKFRA
ncbi:PREDICTED: uncharacterized protein LOC105457888 isoform X1 [Wasmannia auropunctata]|uniref:uncharacterized protein LOC105457888 isoform X1 n=1 Tax=Wasmannia auropunctata TaxID=64793 RepID=UPI0005F00DAF|nr:PREDICTED: uncharacterized protein LOC105457888 isoform X1 [Wasmannia auropunctata]